jgi:hypothetical protein
MKHVCHAPECHIEIPRSMLMCKKHWVMVPLPIQKRVYKHFRVEQLRNEKPTIDWMWAASDAQTAVAHKLGRFSDDQAMEKYRDNARRFHEQASLEIHP